MRLSTVQLTQLETDGYVIVDCPFPRSFTGACLQAIEKVAVSPGTLTDDSKKNHFSLSPIIPDSYWCALDHSLPFLQVALHEEIVELIREIEKTDDIYFRNGGINELAPGRGFLWHRDTEWEHIEIMHYFSNASVSEGCLRVIPASHKGHADVWMDRVRELRRKQEFAYPPAMEGPADVEMEGEIPLEVTSGQIIVRHSKILHATWKNQGNSGRLMHHWVFRRGDQPNHRFTWRDYLTDDLIDSLTEQQKEVLWLDREFEIDKKYHLERERELGKVIWGCV